MNPLDNIKTMVSLAETIETMLSQRYLTKPYRVELQHGYILLRYRVALTEDARANLNASLADFPNVQTTIFKREFEARVMLSTD